MAENERLKKELTLALEALVAVGKYDKALALCAADPEKMTSYCSVEDETLDTLYADMMSKRDRAVAAIESMTKESQ